MLTAQEAEKSAIVDAIRSADSKEIASYFLPSVDLTVESVEDVYSRDQAEMIVRHFFEDHPPTSFQLKHEGKSKLDDYYCIGSLMTKSGKYRLTFFLKKGEEGFRIKQFSIEDLP
jgi:hypothetical protein